jgi:hypothetical protein
MSKAAKYIHVVAAIDGGWSVRREGADRALRHFATKDAAVSWGRKQSMKNRSDLVIHRRDGMIADKSSYGSDPHPPDDRKK